jgi:F0F1-type ATP synthase membrane subunit a
MSAKSLFLTALPLRISVFLTFLVLGAGSAFAADGGDEHGHDLLPLHAEEVFNLGPISITNSMIMVWVVALVLIVVVQAATRNMKLVPSGLQNFVEWLVESLFNFFSGIMGAPRQAHLLVSRHGFHSHPLLELVWPDSRGRDDWL